MFDFRYNRFPLISLVDVDSIPLQKYRHELPLTNPLSSLGRHREDRQAAPTPTQRSPGQTGRNQPIPQRLRRRQEEAVH